MGLKHINNNNSVWGGVCGGGRFQFKVNVRTVLDGAHQSAVFIA